VQARLFPCANRVNSKLDPADGGTRVSWIMNGKNNFTSKAISPIMEKDTMAGKDFE
jgi:hypothetical protein